MQLFEGINRVKTLNMYTIVETSLLCGAFKMLLVTTHTIHMSVAWTLHCLFTISYSPFMVLALLIYYILSSLPLRHKKGSWVWHHFDV